jgi:hypothetical protein
MLFQIPVRAYRAALLNSLKPFTLERIVGLTEQLLWKSEAPLKGGAS